MECFRELKESRELPALAEVPELREEEALGRAASVLRAELNALSLFLNLQQLEEPQERAVWVDQEEEREDVAQLRVELKAV